MSAGVMVASRGHGPGAPAKAGEARPDCPDIARAAMPEDRLDRWWQHRGGSPSEVSS